MTSTPTIALLSEKKKGKKKDRTGKKKKKEHLREPFFCPPRFLYCCFFFVCLFVCLLRNSLAAEAYRLAFVGKAKLHNGKSKRRKTPTKNNMK